MKFPFPFTVPLLCLLLAWHPAAHAHAPEESTTVARLQHERLEITVILSAQMAGALAGVPADAETQEINASNFDAYRARLQEKAPDLLEVLDGDAVLLPTRTQVILNKLTEPTFLLFYPQPKEWPLRLRVRFLGQLPAGYGGTAEIFDANETLLGRRVLGREGEQAELSVRPAPSPADAPVPEVPTPLPATIPSPATAVVPPTHPLAATAPTPSPRAGIAWMALALASAVILFLGLKRTR